MRYYNYFDYLQDNYKLAVLQIDILGKDNFTKALLARRNLPVNHKAHIEATIDMIYDLIDRAEIVRHYVYSKQLTMPLKADDLTDNNYALCHKLCKYFGYNKFCEWLNTRTTLPKNDPLCIKMVPGTVLHIEELMMVNR